MSIRLFNTRKSSDEAIELPSSKSISNRLLIMNALSKSDLNITNISEAEDSVLMQKLLSSKEKELDVSNAGTVIRFLTAFFSSQKGKEVMLDGNARMRERPIGPLVDSLKELGAKIEFLGKEGYPPIQIKGSKLKKKKLKVDASKSSQFVTALLLIAPYINGGLKMELLDPTSKPYIKMSLQLMRKAGIEWEMDGETIKVWEGEYHLKKKIKVEADWSSAAFIYQTFALSSISTIKIHGLQEDSLQGDSYCADIFEYLGVDTDYTKDGVILSRQSYDAVPLTIDLKGQPDLVLPFAVAAAYLLPSVKIKGVASLRLKESNRLEALRAELSKLADLIWEEETDQLKLSIKTIHRGVDCFKISSHDDHRIAMSIAPLTTTYQCLDFDDSEVVRKSFPDFWKEIAKMGIKMGEAI